MIALETYASLASEQQYHVGNPQAGKHLFEKEIAQMFGKVRVVRGNSVNIK